VLILNGLLERGTYHWKRAWWRGLRRLRAGWRRGCSVIGGIRDWR
jgi:hypothetical protein